MGRPETKCRVSPVKTFRVCLLLMLQGHVLFASTIFPLKSNSPSGTVRQSSSSWDIDDVDTETYNDDQEYANFFSEEDFTADDEEKYDKTRKRNGNNIEVESRSDFQNSLESDSKSMVSLPGRFAQDDDGMDENSHNRHASKKGNSFGKIEFIPLISLENVHFHPKEMDRAAGREKVAITSPNNNNKSPDIHNNTNNGNNDVNGNGAKKSSQDKRRMRLVPSKYINTRRMSDSGKKSTATMESSLVNNTVVLINKAAKNQSKHSWRVSGGGGGEKETSSGSLLSKFPYRIIPFPYVSRRKVEIKHKTTRFQSQNTNEDSWTTDPRHKFVNGHVVLLQRRNRSKRDTQQQELQDLGQLEHVLEKAENTRISVDGDPQVSSEQNQQNKSSEKATTGSGESFNIGDEEAKTNVRDNATSRPPPPTPNPVEVLQRLTRLLDRMLRDLSIFGVGQKITLRLIRMTERKDIDQMQELMKDFEISGEKPIFFVAGGLRKRNNGSAATRVTNFTSIFLNETVQNEPQVEQLPVAVNSTSPEVELPPLLDEVDGTTVFPILRPAISSLPVEYDTDNNNDDGEITTVNPEEEESEPVVLVPGQNSSSSDSSSSYDEIPVETVTSSPLITRRKRSFLGVDEFNFLPMGRSARTENPYDEEDEEYEDLPNYDSTSSESKGWRLQNEKNSQHLTSVVPISSGTSSTDIATTNYVPSSSEVIDQSHVQQNDEISLSTPNTIIGQIISTFPTTTSSVVVGSSQEKGSSTAASLVFVNEADADGSNIIPPNDSITIREHVVADNDRSNDHQNPHTNDATVILENNISHEEKYLRRVNPLRAVSIVDNVDVEQPYYSPQSISATQQKIIIIPLNLENKSAALIDSIDEKLRADESLNLVRETSNAEQSREINRGSGNGLEINKSALQTVQVSPFLHNTPELLADKKSKVGAAAALPNKIIFVEDRALGSVSGQNVVQNSPLHDNILIKETRVESGSQEPQSPKLSPTTSTLNKNVVSENERIIIVPPPPPPERTSISSPAVEGPLATDIDSPVTRSIPTFSNDTTIIVPVEAEKVDSILHSSSTIPVLLNRDLATPHSVVVITEPQKSNQNDPQEEIKAASPQVNVSLREPLLLPIATVEEIKEEHTPTFGSVYSSNILDERVVPTLQTKQRTIYSKSSPSINSVVIQDPTIPIRDPIITADTSTKSTIAPLLTELILNGESGENEEQTSHNQQLSLTLGENQEDFVGKQTVVLGQDIMKKVVVGKEERNEIGREKVQVASNQPTFHAPTVLKESQIIGNNGATFPLADSKVSPSLAANVIPIHNSQQVVGTETVVDQPDTNDAAAVVVIQSGTGTDNIDAVVRNTGTVTVRNNSKNSDDASATNENGSIVAPIAKDVDEEVRFPVAPVGYENSDVLSQRRFVAVPQNSIHKKEFSNVGNNILTETVAVPLSNSVGTTDSFISDVPLKLGKPSDNVSPALSLLASDRSKEVLLQHENTILSVPENLSVVTTQHQDVSQEEIKNVPGISAATDLTKLQETDQSKLGLVAAVSLPAANVKTVAPVETPTVDIVKVEPVNNPVIHSLNVAPLDVPMIANPVEIVNSDNLRPSFVEPRNPEALNVDIEKVENGTPKVLVNNTVINASGKANDSNVTFVEIPPAIAAPEKVIFTETNIVIVPVDISTASVTSDTPVGVLQIPKEKAPVVEDFIGSLVDAVLKPPPVVLHEVPELLVTPVSNVVHQSTPQEGQKVTSISQPVILDLPVSAVVPTSDIPYKVHEDDIIIGSLPQTDPDSQFGIKPIDTQPHFQIPGLKPSIPERPHPDYLSIISQGLDTESLLFSTPTNPVVVPSPPVYSGYSPASIFRKQQQMMQNYFSGLLFRRALPA